jgi:hypothetical protein
VAGRDVEEYEFVGSFGFVPGSDFDWIAGVTEVKKLGSLYDATAVDIKTGNDALSEHEAGKSGCEIKTRRDAAEADGRDTLISGTRPVNRPGIVGEPAILEYGPASIMVQPESACRRTEEQIGFGAELVPSWSS